MPNVSDQRIHLFTTCPASNGVDPMEYVQRVIEVAQWSEWCGCTGILVYSDNSLVDPWVVSQIIIQNTRTLCPLVAIQPVYMHPYTVAKLAASFGSLYGRRIYLNMVAGGFKNDLDALNDPTPHDQRYERLVEYTTIILCLLQTAGPISYSGQFYKVDKLKMTPPLRSDLAPGVFVSGSSEAGLAAARALGATAVKYPKSAAEEAGLPETGDWGLRVGIIARPEGREAWKIARARFPEDRKGQLTHQLAMKVSDSVWHEQLSTLPGEVPDNPYWLVPFQNYKTMCPYLVGSFDVVGDEIARYVALGYSTFILDIPPSLEDLEYQTSAFSRALEPAVAR
ncbi:MAG: alkanesulfonate monooxygenase [Acidobacteria bacterium]|nr:MAG: alkanesulfonate monooxygenase [Acidobacteriota bacterium]